MGGETSVVGSRSPAASPAPCVGYCTQRFLNVRHRRRGTNSTKFAVAHHRRRSARSGCPVAALGWPRVSQHVRIARGNVSAAGQIADFTANFQLLLGALGTARGSARDTPQAPTSAALARGVGFVRHVLPQSFQNPSKRSDLHENYPADVELTPPTGGPAWRGPSC